MGGDLQLASTGDLVLTLIGRGRGFRPASTRSMIGSAGFCGSETSRLVALGITGNMKASIQTLRREHPLSSGLTSTGSHPAAATQPCTNAPWQRRRATREWHSESCTA